MPTPSPVTILSVSENDGGYSVPPDACPTILHLSCGHLQASTQTPAEASALVGMEHRCVRCDRLAYEASKRA